MALSDDDAIKPLMVEFVHADFERKAEMVVGWGWTSDQPQLDLKDARVKHHARLSKVYPDVSSWLKEPA